MKTRWFIIFIFMALVSIAGLFIPESDTLYNVVDKNINYADTSWMITSSVLVLLMTPGVSFFYGGMVRAKNIISTMLQSFIAMGIISIIWVIFGFSLAFGDDIAGIIGNPFTFFMFKDVGYATHALLSPTIPLVVFALFQMKFAILTPALITGSFAERVHFSAYVYFIILFSIFVYAPIAHMLWHPEGIFKQWGVTDFAGGLVVHTTSGIAALSGALFLGKRKNRASIPVNIPFVLLGVALLWIGWFGFNAGSALKANGLAVHAFMTTAVSAAAGMLSWMAMDVWMNKKPTLVGSVTGLIVGLVAITPGAGYVPIWSAIIIGLVGSPICYLMISKGKKRFGYDDALDAFGCHGIGGIWGGIATGLFAQTSINSVARWNGLFFGDTQLLVAQIISILVTVLVAVAGTLICIAIVRLFTTLRVEKREEQIGLDISQHNETAYPSFNGLD